MSNPNWDKKLAHSRDEAVNSYRRWTQEEDYIIRDAVGTRKRDPEVACRLGRSIAAVQLRRHRLRAQGKI